MSSGQTLVKALDAAGMAPRLAMWVHAPDMDTWKLWIVPAEGTKDKHEFYRRLAELISKNRNVLGDLSASDIEFVSADHPAVKGIGQFIYAPGVGAAHFSGNRFNNFYLPDGIILRSAFDRRSVSRT